MMKRIFTNWLTIATVLLVGVSVLVVKNWPEDEQKGSGRSFGYAVRESFSVSVTERGVVRPAMVSRSSPSCRATRGKSSGWLKRELL